MQGQVGCSAKGCEGVKFVLSIPLLMQPNCNYNIDSIVNHHLPIISIADLPQVNLHVIGMRDYFKF
jgi:hypothetical protein